MLIFDMDGTLWVTTEKTKEASDIIVRKYNTLKEITKEQIEKGMGLGSKEVAKIYMPYLELEESLKYLEEINQKTIELIGDSGAKLYEGVEETIKILNKHYKLAIVTNNNDDYVKALFKSTGLEEYFTDYIGAAGYNITKSEAISTIINRNKEEHNYYIGDIEKDKIAAEQAGVTFIHAKYGFEPNVKTNLYINNIKELPSLLDNKKKI